MVKGQITCSNLFLSRESLTFGKPCVAFAQQFVQEVSRISQLDDSEITRGRRRQKLQINLNAELVQHCISIPFKLRCSFSCIRNGTRSEQLSLINFAISNAEVRLNLFPFLPAIPQLIWFFMRLYRITLTLSGIKKCVFNADILQCS